MKHPLDNLCRVLHRRLRAAEAHAATMQGLPNEIAEAKGVALGLEEAYGLACEYRRKVVGK